MRLISREESIYGYRKLTKGLRREYALCINKKKVYRLCKELEILLPQRKKKNKYSRRVARNQVVDGVNHH
jgi:putative transposase